MELCGPGLCHSHGFDADRKLIAQEMDSGFFSKVGAEETAAGNDLLAQLAALVKSNPALVKELLDKVMSRSNDK